MKLDIKTEPYRAKLIGFGGPIESGDIPATGMKLMDKMWTAIEAAKFRTKGINHWVYLPDSMIFVGVELADGAAGADTAAGGLETLDVSIDRYVEHLHRGPYAELPKIWPELMTQIRESNETPEYPDLEIYGHWNADPNLCETTIIIALGEPKVCSQH